MIGEIADFIKKERAVVGDFELSGTVGMGIGERAFHVSEKLAFKKAFGDGAHIHAYHFLAAACGKGVYFAGKHLFARTVFTGDKDIGVGDRHFFYQHAKLLHDGTFSPIHGRSGGGGFSRCFLFLFGCRGVLCGVQQSLYQLSVIPGLDDKVCCTFLYPAHSKVYVGISGEQYYGEFRILLLYFAQPVKTFVSGVDAGREIHVEQHYLPCIFV